MKEKKLNKRELLRQFNEEFKLWDSNGSYDLSKEERKIVFNYDLQIENFKKYIDDMKERKDKRDKIIASSDFLDYDLDLKKIDNTVKISELEEIDNLFFDIFHCMSNFKNIFRIVYYGYIDYDDEDVILFRKRNKLRENPFVVVYIPINDLEIYYKKYKGNLFMYYQLDKINNLLSKIGLFDHTFARSSHYICRESFDTIDISDIEISHVTMETTKNIVGVCDDLFISSTRKPMTAIGIPVQILEKYWIWMFERGNYKFIKLFTSEIRDKCPDVRDIAVRIVENIFFKINDRNPEYDTFYEYLSQIIR